MHIKTIHAPTFQVRIPHRLRLHLIIFLSVNIFYQTANLLSTLITSNICTTCTLIHSKIETILDGTFNHVT